MPRTKEHPGLPDVLEGDITAWNARHALIGPLERLAAKARKDQSTWPDLRHVKMQAVEGADPNAIKLAGSIASLSPLGFHRVSYERHDPPRLDAYRGLTSEEQWGKAFCSLLEMAVDIVPPLEAVGIIPPQALPVEPHPGWGIAGGVIDNHWIGRLVGWVYSEAKGRRGPGGPSLMARLSLPPPEGVVAEELTQGIFEAIERAANVLVGEIQSFVKKSATKPIGEFTAELPQALEIIPRVPSQPADARASHAIPNEIEGNGPTVETDEPEPVQPNEPDPFLTDWRFEDDGRHLTPVIGARVMSDDVLRRAVYFAFRQNVHWVTIRSKIATDVETRQGIESQAKGFAERYALPDPVVLRNEAKKCQDAERARSKDKGPKSKNKSKSKDIKEQE